jgi:ACR3 family arsenite efflux pump ArsB
MVVGIAFGKILPQFVTRVSNWEFGRESHVNVAIAILIWLMIYPMMLKIDFGGLKDVAKKPKGLLITLFVNWLIKPFSMAFLGWLFIQVLFSKALGWNSEESTTITTTTITIGKGKRRMILPSGYRLLDSDSRLSTEPAESANSNPL